jgi:hypothetical protein
MSAASEALTTRRVRPAKGRMAGVKVRGTVVESGRRAGVVLASEGRPFTAAAIARAAAIAEQQDTSVLVLSVARVHGTAFGLQHSGLMPTKQEWDEQTEHTRKAVTKLGRQGVAAEGQVLGTRNPAKRICALAYEVGAGAIVMGADPPRNRMAASMMWTQEPQAVARRSKVPVHLITDDPGNP